MRIADCGIRKDQSYVSIIAYAPDRICYNFYNADLRFTFRNPQSAIRNPQSAFRIQEAVHGD